MGVKIILASASPRRRELLEQIGWEFEQRVSRVEEVMEGDSPAHVVEGLSRQKALAVLEQVGRQEKSPEEPEQRTGVPGRTERWEKTSDVLIIGADTVVEKDGEILGKPADREAAVRMLEQLQGTEHRVYTGVTICFRGMVKTFHEETTVSLFSMTAEEIEEYAESGEPMDKAGAYGIQGLAARYVSGISGDYNNVVGLPVGRLYQEVKNLFRTGR